VRKRSRNSIFRFRRARRLRAMKRPIAIVKRGIGDLKACFDMGPGDIWVENAHGMLCHPDSVTGTMWHESDVVR